MIGENTDTQICVSYFKACLVTVRRAGREAIRRGLNQDYQGGNTQKIIFCNYFFPVQLVFFHATIYISEMSKFCHQIIGINIIQLLFIFLIKLKMENYFWKIIEKEMFVEIPEHIKFCFE